MIPTSSPRLVRPDSTEWEWWLDGQRRDVYHLASYHALAASTDSGESFMLVVGDREQGLAWPYVLRSVGEVPGLEGRQEKDVTSVYGYPGPIAWGLTSPQSCMRAAWPAITSTWRAQGAVTAFTRFHPLLGNASLAEQLHGAGADSQEGEGLSFVGRTVSIDCSLTDEQARGAYSKKLRQEIAATRRAGLQLRHDVEWAALPAFLDLYRDTMTRSGAASQYYVDEEEVIALRSALGDHLHLLVAEIDGRVAAAGLFTEFQGLVQAHLAGTDERLRARSPLKVLLDFARQWARDRGAGVLHLGGGRGGREDSLFDFKSRFSPRRHDFHTGRWVLDRAAHDSLTHARRRAVGPLTNDYFPAYRAGPVHHVGSQGMTGGDG